MTPRPPASLPILDLDLIPYTVPYSRLFVRTDGDALTIYRAAYERSLADSMVLGSLRIHDPDGEPLTVLRATPLGVEFDAGITLVVTREDMVSVGPLPPGARVSAELAVASCEGQLVTDRLRHPDDAILSSSGSLTVLDLPSGGDVLVACSAMQPATRDHAEALESGQADVKDWLSRCPVVHKRWEDLVRLCWWVLGVNTLELGGAVVGRAVVPSKLGYVGLWQWDAYFIAVGLRHGDPNLAAEQLRIALSQAQTSGQLPDVLHEEGVLASSDDLPPADLVSLRAMGSPSLENSRIPLTKPPLTALAVQLVAEQAGESLIDDLLDTILSSQDWWYAESDPRGDGVPAYLHPYSSGLDDSPIFDHDAMVSSPDLAAYLIVQDRILTGWLTERGRNDEAARCRRRADASTIALTALWAPVRGFFPSVGESGEPLPTDAIVGLLPLLVNGLPPDIAAGLVAAIRDPERYNTPHRLPTVAADDATFSPERMWRGPVWVNMNWLVARGLREQGFFDEADDLERGTLDMAVLAQGPHEYFNPLDGSKAPTATTCFGWSSALLVDMAVRLSTRQ